MTHFEKLQKNSDIHELIKSTFDADLPLSGGWGYDEEGATIIKSLPAGMTLVQLEHMITSIRAHLEMNITQEQDKRYAGINTNERAREGISNEKGVFNKVSYEITGIKESLYNAFIKEYKEGYGKENFDLNAHFERRKEATLVRKITHYFEVSALL